MTLPALSFPLVADSVLVVDSELSTDSPIALEPGISHGQRNNPSHGIVLLLVSVYELLSDVWNV